MRFPKCNNARVLVKESAEAIFSVFLYPASPVIYNFFVTLVISLMIFPNKLILKILCNPHFLSKKNFV